METNQHLAYHGLVTRRIRVEAPTLLASSTATVKVKTSDVSASQWEEVNGGTLDSSFESSFSSTL